MENKITIDEIVNRFKNSDKAYDRYEVHSVAWVLNDNGHRYVKLQYFCTRKFTDGTWHHVSNESIQSIRNRYTEYNDNGIFVEDFTV